MREARTFRTIPTIRTIRTRLRQAAPWQAARKPWNGARGRNGFPHCSAGTPVVPQHTKKCGGIFTRCRGFSPARGLGRAAPCSSRRRFHPPKDERRRSESRRGKTRTFRTIRTIRTRLRQAAPWQAARKPWNGARVRNGFPHCSAVVWIVSRYTGKCGEHLPQGAGP